MTCASSFSVYDGTTTVTVTVGSVSDSFSISREQITDGQDVFRAANGSASNTLIFDKKRYTINGSGPADPGLWALSIATGVTWTVTIPGFANGSANETWTVLPARPSQTRDRRGGVHSWTLTLEDA